MSDRDENNARDYFPGGASWERLIMTFPLNGVEGDGHRIYIHENADNGSNFFVITNDQSDTRWERPTLAGAIRLCLNNSGWGQYRIEDITNV